MPALSSTTISLEWTPPQPRPAPTHARLGPARHRWSTWVAVGSLGMALCAPALSQGSAWTLQSESETSTAAAAAAHGKDPVGVSALDGELFYQVLIAEIEANSGNAGTAYQIYVEAARRRHEPQLYQRAVEIALRARAGEQALSAAQAWHQAMPQSREAAEYTSQILIALGRTKDLAASLHSYIQLTPEPEQPPLLLSLPRSLARLSDHDAAAQIIDDATQTWRQGPSPYAEAWDASAQAWLMAKQTDKAWAADQRALAIKPDLLSAQLLAVDLVGQVNGPEAWVVARLSKPDAPSVLELAYARRLAALQRYPESEAHLSKLLQKDPSQVGNWLLLAAVRLETHDLDGASTALHEVLSRTEPSNVTPASPPTPAAGAASASASAEGASAASDDNDAQLNANRDREQAYLLMAQLADQRGKPDQALSWLDRADPNHEHLSVQGQRARLLAALGRLQDALAAIQGVPEEEPRDAVVKAQAQAQLLRDAHDWQAAYELLSKAVLQFPEDPDLLYDQAMAAEKLHRFEEMERILRQVIVLDPDNPNAYNALGYSLADRKIKLDEAQHLIAHADALHPGDPYIIDSLGWAAYRMGRVEEATRLLKSAFDSRADPEIAAHLGEVLWSQGQTDEAKRIWHMGWEREHDNETLQETLKRFGVAF